MRLRCTRFIPLLLCLAACDADVVPPPDMTPPPPSSADAAPPDADLPPADAAPPHLAFRAAPQGGMTGTTLAPAIQVIVDDGTGHVSAGATPAVTLAIGSGPSGAILSGTSTMTAVAGVATFADLKLDLKGTYVLRASASGFDPVWTPPFVMTGAPQKLLFYNIPGTTDAGSPISPALQIWVVDAAGARVTGGPQATVTMALATNPASGVLSGTRTVTAVAGVATFAGLSIDKPGTGYALAATATSLTGATSPPFNVRIGPAALATFTAQPHDAHLSQPLAPVQVTVTDAAGNTVTSSANVTMSLGANPGGATLSGTLTRGTTAGVATFDDLRLDKVAAGYTLSAAVATATPASSTSFAVLADAWAAANQGLFGGPVTSVAVEPTHGAVILASTGQATWRSSDGGASWSRIAACPDHATHQVRFAGTGTDAYANCLDHLGVSHDTGATWSLVGPLGTGSDLTDLAVSPSVPGLVAMLDYNYVYITHDGGATWSRTQIGPSNARVAFDPADPQTVLVTANGVVYRSGDGGATFAASNGFGYALAFAPGTPGRVYVADISGSLSVSIDHGRTFSRGGALGRFCSAMAVDPANGTHILFTTDDGVWESHDAAMMVMATGGGLPSGMAGLEVAFDGNHVGRVFLAGTGVGLFTSADGGASWQESDRGITAVSVPQLAGGGAGPVFAANTNAIYRSRDGGASWQRVFTGYYMGPVAVDPAGHLYVTVRDAVTASYHLMASSDGGDTFQALPGWSPSDAASAIAVDPTDARKLYVAGAHIWISGDAGQSFHQAPSDPPVTYQAHLLVDPAHPLVIWGDRSDMLVRSTDGGASWADAGAPSSLSFHGLDPFDGTPYVSIYSATPLLHLLAGVWQATAVANLHNISALAFDPQHRGTVYAANSSRLVRSGDAMATWSDASSGVPSYVFMRSLLVDPVNPTVMYMGGDSGVFKTTTAGQ